MTGNNRIILQPRDLHLLKEFAVMCVLSRELAMIVAGFRSTTRINARLLALYRAGLLRRFFLGSGGGRKALYALSAKGALLLGVPLRGPRRPQDAMLVADYFVGHQLAVNGIHCALKYGVVPIPHVTFHRWLSFFEPIVPGINLIPDGYVEFMTPAGIEALFIEVDLGHESQKVLKGKVRNYLELAVTAKYQERFGQDHFRVLVIANSERRLHSIRNTVAKTTEKIFRFATLDSARDAFFGSVWLRPQVSQLITLFSKP